MSIGSRWDDRITGKLSVFCKDAVKIHVDIDVAEPSAVRARVYGDAVVLTGRNAIKVRSERRQGQLLETQILFTAVYAKIADRWQLTVWQSTAAR